MFRPMRCDAGRDYNILIIIMVYGKSRWPVPLILQSYRNFSIYKNHADYQLCAIYNISPLPRDPLGERIWSVRVMVGAISVASTG